jgi:hypothetical protein
MPLGPKLVRTITATVFAAIMLFFCASLHLVSLAPTFNNKTGIPPADPV